MNSDEVLPRADSLMRVNAADTSIGFGAVIGRSPRAVTGRADWHRDAMSISN